MTSERDLLVEAVTAQRGHILEDLEGLSDQDLSRSVLPSGWTCAGLVHHLAIDVERFWFRDVFAGDPVGEYPENAWHAPADLSPAEVILLYKEEIVKADAVIAAASLDDPPRHWPDQWPTWRLEDLREILMHVITETACHAGHLDAARELIDGHQAMVLTE